MLHGSTNIFIKLPQSPLYLKSRPFEFRLASRACSELELQVCFDYCLWSMRKFRNPSGFAIQESLRSSYPIGPIQIGILHRDQHIAGFHDQQKGIAICRINLSSCIATVHDQQENNLLGYLREMWRARVAKFRGQHKRMARY